MKRTIRLTESDIHNIIRESVMRILTESQESKSIDAAKKLLVQQLGYSPEQADEFVRIRLRNDFPVLRDKNAGKFILGVTRMFVDGQLNDVQTIGNLNKTLKYVASEAHINEYDRNLNGMSAQDLIQRFAKNIETDMENDRNEVNSMRFGGNSQYDIVPINTFEEAQEYAQYTDWCVTDDEEMFDSYTSNGFNQFYFCLKRGFEQVPREQGENCPLDEYGLSMIAVCVNDKGGLNSCTCRWNHDNGGNEMIMDTKQISQVIGRNFYDAFKPNNTWNETVEDAMQGIANGKSPFDVFDYCSGFSEDDGYAIVGLKERYNFINAEGNLLSPDQWFDYCTGFSEDGGFASVELNNKFNFINQEGRLLTDLPTADGTIKGKWFDWCGGFANGGFSVIRLNKKYNLMDANGKLFSPNWFDWCSNFRDGFAIIQVDGKCNFMSTEGNILSPNQWFDKCEVFIDGLAKVTLNKEGNYINTEGNLLSPNQWFDYCDSFYDGSAVVVFNGKRYVMDTECNLYDYHTQRPLGINAKTMGSQNESIKNTFVNMIVEDVMRQIRRDDI